MEKRDYFSLSKSVQIGVWMGRQYWVYIRESLGEQNSTTGHAAANSQFFNLI